MCRSGVWIEALGQANACYTWCTSRYQADWKRNFGQLLRQHVMSDAVGYKLEVIFGLEPVSLLSVRCPSMPPHRVRASVLHFVFLPMLPSVGLLSLVFYCFLEYAVALCFSVFFGPPPSAPPPSARLLPLEFVYGFLTSDCSINMLHHAGQRCLPNALAALRHSHDLMLIQPCIASHHTVSPAAH